MDAVCLRQDLEPIIQGPNVSNVLDIVQSGVFGLKNIQSLASRGTIYAPLQALSMLFLYTAAQLLNTL